MGYVVTTMVALSVIPPWLTPSERPVSGMQSVSVFMTAMTPTMVHELLVTLKNRLVQWSTPAATVPQSTQQKNAVVRRYVTEWCTLVLVMCLPLLVLGELLWLTLLLLTFTVSDPLCTPVISVGLCMNVVQVMVVMRTKIVRNIKSGRQLGCLVPGITIETVMSTRFALVHFMTPLTELVPACNGCGATLVIMVIATAWQV